MKFATEHYDDGTTQALRSVLLFRINHAINKKFYEMDTLAKVFTTSNEEWLNSFKVSSSRFYNRISNNENEYELSKKAVAKVVRRIKGYGNSDLSHIKITRKVPLLTYLVEDTNERQLKLIYQH